MALSRLARRVVVALASALLLLCQTTALALTPLPAVAGDPAFFAPCHEAVALPGDADKHAQRHDCPSQYASPGFAKVDVPPALDAPSFTAQPDGAAPLPREAWTAAALPARAESPPLAILHCRLRN